MREPIVINGVTITNLYKPPRSNPEEWPTSELTGEKVDPYREAWRHECECRSILDGMPTRAQRTKQLDGIEKFRGKPSADALRADILFLHYFRQANACKSREELEYLAARVRDEQRLAAGTNDLVNRIMDEWFRRHERGI